MSLEQATWDVLRLHVPPGFTKHRSWVVLRRDFAGMAHGSGGSWGRVLRPVGDGFCATKAGAVPGT